MASFPESLRDALLRDAISNIADNESKVCQIMLTNINTYIEVAHHLGYTADLMQGELDGKCNQVVLMILSAIGIALTNIARRSSDWPISFDPGPILLMSSTILQHNKVHSRVSLLLFPAIVTTSEELQFQELLSSVETVLRAALTRFNVGTECLSHIFHVTSTLFRKTQSRPGTAGQAQPNTIAMTIFEILAEGLHKEGRVTPSTVACVIEVNTNAPPV